MAGSCGKAQGALKSALKNAQVEAEHVVSSESRNYQPALNEKCARIGRLEHCGSAIPLSRAGLY
jgi:hypothetical protein